MKKFFIRLYNYCIANQFRKIFYISLIATIGFALFFIFVQIPTSAFLLQIGVITCMFSTFLDSIHSRSIFMEKVRNMQAEHFAEIIKKQEKGEAVEVTSPFSPEDAKVIKNKNLMYRLIIIAKALISLTLFMLIFSV